jgi:hypothetical protein
MLGLYTLPGTYDMIGGRRRRLKPNTRVTERNQGQIQTHARVIEPSLAHLKSLEAVDEAFEGAQ